MQQRGRQAGSVDLYGTVLGPHFKGQLLTQRTLKQASGLDQKILEVQTLGLQRLLAGICQHPGMLSRAVMAVGHGYLAARAEIFGRGPVKRGVDTAL